MKYVMMAFAIGALFAGANGARYWYKSSKAKWVPPSWDSSNKDKYDAERLNWLVGSAMWNITEVGRLNARAAIWSGAALILGTVANLLNVPFSN
jgi:hypothetical protein